MDTASSQPGGLLLPKPIAQESTTDSQPAADTSGLPQGLIQELWLVADAETCGLTVQEFGTTLASVGTKLNYGLPHGGIPDPVQKATFLRSLRHSELALAHSCVMLITTAGRAVIPHSTTLTSQRQITTPEPVPAELSRLSEAVARTLRDIAPEDRTLQTLGWAHRSARPETMASFPFCCWRPSPCRS